MTNGIEHVTIARDDDVYEGFPDVCMLPGERLLCIYRESDAHVASTSRIMLIESHDRGRTWTNQRQFEVRRSFADDKSVWINTRIARLSDGRLVINYDAFVYPDSIASHGAAHGASQAYLACQTFLSFSEDEGKTWTERHLIEAEGIVGDRLLVVRDDLWLLAIPHFMGRFPDAFRVEVARSHDGGRTWPISSLAAEEEGFQHDEPSLLVLPDGRLLMVMRENVHTNRPSHYVISEDEGWTWSAPRPTPFYGDRPSAGLLQSGRLLVAYRNVEPAPDETITIVGRNPGTWAWLGDLSGLTGTGGESRFLELEYDPCVDMLGDYGYSAWVQFEDGEIFCTYHHREKAPQSYIRGCWFREEDFAN